MFVGDAVSSGAKSPLPGLEALWELRAITGAPRAGCPRLLSIGGSCMCNFRDHANLTENNIEFDRHVYGRRELCIGAGYLQPGRCALLSLQTGTISGEQRRLAEALRSFGCSEQQVALVDAEAELGRWEAFSLRRLMRQRGLKSLDVLDVSVEGREERILAEVTRLPARVAVRQVALAVVLDRGEAEGDGSTFSSDRLSAYLRLMRALQTAGYRLLSYNPNPKCVQTVRQMSGMCLPVFFDTTWIQ